MHWQKVKNNNYESLYPLDWMAVNVSDSIYLFGLSLEGHHLIQLFKFHPGISPFFFQIFSSDDRKRITVI